MNNVSYIMTSTRPAKCKDCKFILYDYIGKRKLHFCALSDKQVTLKDRVCNKWQIGTGVPCNRKQWIYLE